MTITMSPWFQLVVEYFNPQTNELVTEKMRFASQEEAESQFHFFEGKRKEKNSLYRSIKLMKINREMVEIPEVLLGEDVEIN